MCYFVEINLPRKALEDRFNVFMPFDSRYMPGFFLNAFARPFLPVITGHYNDRVQYYNWGLIPFWVRDEKTAEKISNGTYNAKSETIWEKPSFRDAARHKRCLVLAHGFFEWHTTDKGKIPFYIKRRDDKPFAFAGLHDSWTNPDTGEIRDTFSIITTRANPMLEKIHNSKKRMPVILSETNEKEWLRNDAPSTELDNLLLPADDDVLEAWSISRRIATKDVDPSDSRLLDPVEYPETRELLN